MPEGPSIDHRNLPTLMGLHRAILDAPETSSLELPTLGHAALILDC